MITIETNVPVALDSLDHIHPHGTGWDNSVWPPFNDKLFALTKTPRLLDIGCAGGGLVKSIIDDGGFAVGVEGSDLSQRTNRAEWATIPANLFTGPAGRTFYQVLHLPECVRAGRVYPHPVGLPVVQNNREIFPFT